MSVLREVDRIFGADRDGSGRRRYDSTRPPDPGRREREPERDDPSGGTRSACPSARSRAARSSRRRAIEEIVRAAVLGSYGVIGFVDDDRVGQDPPARWASGGPGVRVRTTAGLLGRAPADGRLRAARRRGRPPGRFGRPLRARRALDREPDRLTIHVGGMRYEPCLGAAGQCDRNHPWRRVQPRPARPTRRGRTWRGPSVPKPTRSPPTRRPSAHDPSDLRRRGAPRRVPRGVSPTSRPMSTRSTRSTSSRCPDGDTGSNMVATVRAALEEAEGAAGQPADRIAAAISFGALMGARGNSGVITSQILRGMAAGLAASAASTASTWPTPWRWGPRPPTRRWRSRSRARS